MNLLFRLFWLWIRTRFGKSVGFLDEITTSFIVMPTDLDLLWHVNNGKYFSIMDLGRQDLLLRSPWGVFLKSQGWYLVIASECLRFRQSLHVFQNFQLKTKILGWDDKYFYIGQSFYHDHVVKTHGFVKGRLLKKTGGTVDPAEVFKAMEHNKIQAPVPPKLPDFVHQWMKTEELLRKEAQKTRDL